MPDGWLLRTTRRVFKGPGDQREKRTIAEESSWTGSLSLCCLHYKVYMRIVFFCTSRQICYFGFFWSNTALWTFWVADPCSTQWGRDEVIKFHCERVRPQSRRHVIDMQVTHVVPEAEAGPSLGPAGPTTSMLRNSRRWLTANAELRYVVFKKSDPGARWCEQRWAAACKNL